jgi:hypothetical protein
MLLLLGKEYWLGLYYLDFYYEEDNQEQPYWKLIIVNVVNNKE